MYFRFVIIIKVITPEYMRRTKANRLECLHVWVHNGELEQCLKSSVGFRRQVYTL